MPRKIEPYNRIAVAIGGEYVNPQVIHEAVRLSTLVGAKLYAVHMRYPYAGKPTMMMDALPKFSEDDIRSHFSKRGYKELAEKVPVKIYEGTNVAKLLARVTKNVDLLIVGHIQRNRLLAALLAQPLHMQIMDIVSCPVIVVPKPRRRK